MCGIGGVFGDQVGLDPVIASAVRRMVTAQVSRGPDDEGLLQREDIVLGHCRLSIVDLSSAGKQPMTNENGTIWVVYNGEIYNHQELRRELQRHGHCFTSSSDTEVLIHGYEEWGIEELLRRLRGMFVFALYDGRPETGTSVLFLARDRFGIKPLYYSPLQIQNQDGIVFASEVRALTASNLVRADDNPRAWLAFLMFGSVPTPWTTLREVLALPPGNYLAIDKNTTQLIRYYALEDLFIVRKASFTKKQGISSCSTKEIKKDKECYKFEQKIRGYLENTVSLHLISDAPLGVFLSGGIDSSALVALAAARKPDLNTLSVIFKEENYSEEDYQRKVTERFRTQHHWISVTKQDFEKELDRFLSVMDQPTVDGVNTYFIAQAARQVGLKAVLSGLGGDEVFCGYPTLRRAPTLWRLRALPSPLRTAAVVAGSLRPSLRKLAFLRHKSRLSFYLAQRGLFTPEEAARLLGTTENEAWEVIEMLEPLWAPQDPVLLQQFLEIRHYLRDQLLRDADVFGMAHSVEIRVPFLDHVLAEMVLRTPLAWRRDSRWPKPLLTRPLQDLLPEQVVFRPKQGFTFPMEVWLRSIDCEILSDAALELDTSAYSAVWELFLSGRAHWSRPWALTVLASARRHNGLPDASL